MRRLIVRAIVSLAVLSGTTLAFAFSTGPPASRTNAASVAGKPAEANCTVCHMGAPINSGPGMVEILDVPSSFTPGQIYPLRVRVTLDHPPDAVPKWGFQIQAVDSTTGDSAGSWIYPLNLRMSPNPSQASTFRHRRYLEHGADTSSVYHGWMGPVEWTFAWQSPADSNRRKVYFFAAGNAANGDGCSNCGGDFIFSDAESTGIAVDTIAVGVPFVPLSLNTHLAAPFPNPFTQCLDLFFEIAKAGVVDLSIYDIQGRKVRTIFHGYHVAGVGQPYWNGRRDDGTQAKNGIYFVKLSAPGLSRPISRRVTLAR